MKQFIPKSILMLFFLTLAAGCSDRKVLQEIPLEIRGVWIGMYSDPEISIILKRDKLDVINKERPLFSCKAEEIISYKVGWILRENKIAVTCDKKSTDNDQMLSKKLGISAPDNYRKTFHINMPNKLGEISVSHTKFMSRGFSDSEGIYDWGLDDFYKGPDCDISAFNNSVKNRQIDQNSSLAITIPKSWSVKKKKEGAYSEMLIKSSGSCKITILISSRPLDAWERKISTISLIEKMLKSSLGNLRSQGHQIVNYGKYKEFKPEWPSFVIVSGESSGKRVSTSYGTVVENRNFAIVALTRNKQHSEDLADILRNVIESLEIL